MCPGAHFASSAVAPATTSPRASTHNRFLFDRKGNFLSNKKTAPISGNCLNQEERQTGLEPATSTLARWRTTNCTTVAFTFRCISATKFIISYVFIKCKHFFHFFYIFMKKKIAAFTYHPTDLSCSSSLSERKPPEYSGVFRIRFTPESCGCNVFDAHIPHCPAICDSFPTAPSCRQSNAPFLQDGSCDRQMLLQAAHIEAPEPPQYPDA